MKGKISLIIAVLFFLLSVAVSVMLFVRAAELRQQARDTDRAARAIQTAIEEFKASGNVPDIRFDDDFTLTMDVTQDGNLYDVTVTAMKDTTELLSFHTAAYREDNP